MPKKKLKDFGLYFITDSTLTKRSVIEDVKSAIKAGIRIIQYREKNASAKQMMLEASQIKDLCRKNSVLFLVNDRVDVALAVDADGVHLGEKDIPYHYARKLLGNKKIIGLSAHSVKDALNNQKMGADYTGIGPIYYTATKKDSSTPIGLGPISRLRNKLRIPFVAIGGINEANIDEVLNAGAKNVAIISAIVAKDDVSGAVSYFKDKIGKNRK